MNKVAGEHTKCCVNKSYDSRTSSCCNANVSLIFYVLSRKEIPKKSLTSFNDK